MSNTPFMKHQRINWYNRRKKPWRSRSFLKTSVRTAMRRKSCVFRACLCCITAAELIVIRITDPGIFTKAGHLLQIDLVTERSVEQTDLEEESTYPFDKKDSGVTIDLKEGKVEFWRTEEKVRREGTEGTGPEA